MVLCASEKMVGSQQRRFHSELLGQTVQCAASQAACLYSSNCSDLDPGVWGPGGGHTCESCLANDDVRNGENNSWKQHLLAVSVCRIRFNSLSTLALCIHHPIKHVLHVWYWLYEVFPALEAAGLIIKHLPRNYIRTTLMSSTIRNCPDSDSMQEKK